MKKLILIFTFLLIKVSYSTEPSPDLLIIEDDTLALRSMSASRLFKSYWRAKRELVEQGGRSTACYAFREMWEIKNDSLFLKNIISCSSTIRTLDSTCFNKLKSTNMPSETINKLNSLSGKTYTTTLMMYQDLKNYLSTEDLNKYYGTILKSATIIPGIRTYLNYKHLLKPVYRKNNGFAKSFSDLLFVEKGNPIDSMLIYYRNPTDLEVIYSFKKGIVESIKIIDAIYLNNEYKGKSITIAEYKFPVLENWHFKDSSKSTYQFRQTESIINYDKVIKRGRWNKSSRFRKAERILNKKIKSNVRNFKFSDYKYSKLIYKGRVHGDYAVPYIGYIDGDNPNKNRFIKLITLFTGIEMHQITIEANSKNELNKLFLNVVSNIVYKRVREL